MMIVEKCLKFLINVDFFSRKYFNKFIRLLKKIV